jgi:hypothetical protein
LVGKPLKRRHKMRAFFRRIEKQQRQEAAVQITAGGRNSIIKPTATSVTPPGKNF